MGLSSSLTNAVPDIFLYRLTLIGHNVLPLKVAECNSSRIVLLSLSFRCLLSETLTSFVSLSYIPQYILGFV